MPSPTPASDPASQYKQLQERYTALDRRRATAKSKLEDSTAELNRLKAEAMKLYGTDNLDELRRNLAEMKQANEAMLAKYARHLEEIEAKLAAVDQQYAQVR